MMNNWQERFDKSLQACAKKNGICRELIIANPATEQQISSIETELNISIPSSFRDVLLNFSKHVEVIWQLPRNSDIPEIFRGVFRGDCHWNIENLIDLEKNRLDWVSQCFPNPNDAYDRVWHKKLAFQHISTGDLLALDLEVEGSPVVYLSHDGDPFHGTILGNNFSDFIERWSLIGCVGAEDWQLEKFVSDKTHGLEPLSDKAKKWREWFELDINV
jgi:hypothetical protein